VCARSSYFRAMLAGSSSFAEAHMDQVPVQVESGAVFSQVVRYMYSGDAEALEPGTAFDVLNAAHMYGLGGLQALAEDHIASAYLDAENVVDILNATSGILVSRLRVHAIAFLLTHLGEIARAGDVPLRAAVRRMQDAGAGRAELEDLVQGAVEMLEIEDARLHELVIERAVAWGVVDDVIDGGDCGPDDAGLRGQGDDDNGRATGDGDDDDGGPAFIYIDAPSGEEKRK